MAQGELVDAPALAPLAVGGARADQRGRWEVTTRWSTTTMFGEGALLLPCELTSALRDRSSFDLWAFGVEACGR